MVLVLGEGGRPHHSFDGGTTFSSCILLYYSYLQLLYYSFLLPLFTTALLLLVTTALCYSYLPIAVHSLEVFAQACMVLVQQPSVLRDRCV